MTVSNPPGVEMEDFPKDLEGIMTYLRGNGWEFKLTSRRIEDGTYRFTATVWRMDELGGSYKCRNVQHTAALIAALLDARKRRNKRAQRRRERDRAAGLERVA